MGLEKKANYYFADMNLMNRRTKRVMEATKRFLATCKTDSRLDRNIDWWVDHLLFVFDLLWSLILPIVSYLWMSILMIVMIIVFNVIFIYALYLLLTH
jgi:hypothetical protein